MSRGTAPYMIYTIGHSTRSIDAFVDLLRPAGVRQLVDVRTIPRSPTNPHYNSDVLGETLAVRQIGYTVIPELGGRRKRQKEVDTEVNAYWQNQSFHNYADYALSPAFHIGLNQLTAIAREAPALIMCAEAVWWRCHRRIIVDYLLVRDCSVCRLMGTDRIETAKFTLGAVIAGDVIVYPPGSDRHVEPDDENALAPSVTEHAPLCRYEELANRENRLRALAAGSVDPTE